MIEKPKNFGWAPVGNAFFFVDDNNNINARSMLRSSLSKKMFQSSYRASVKGEHIAVTKDGRERLCHGVCCDRVSLFLGPRQAPLGIPSIPPPFTHAKVKAKVRGSPGRDREKE